MRCARILLFLPCCCGILHAAFFSCILYGELSMMEFVSNILKKCSTCIFWLFPPLGLFFHIQHVQLECLQDGLPLGWHKAFPPLRENLRNWAVFLWEAEEIYRSSINCIFLWTYHLKYCCEILKQVDQRGCRTSNLRDAENGPGQS